MDITKLFNKLVQDPNNPSPANPAPEDSKPIQATDLLPKNRFFLIMIIVLAIAGLLILINNIAK